MTDTPDPIDVAVGARLRIQRRQLDLSQGHLAAALGITFQQVQKYERGKNRVSASMLVKAAAVLKTSVAALVGEDGAEPVKPIVLAQLSTEGAPALLAAYTLLDGDTRRAFLTIAEGLKRPQPRRLAA
jgi:transcriptional regulator with XRE-family HTH domain